MSGDTIGINDMTGKFTLSTFYKSDEWYKLTRTIKLERVNESGLIICEHCKKAITKPYDCICHHYKTYLTEENVNNYDISLNPDNIMLVHHKCHNEIHNKLGYVNREVFLVYGSPLSGTSTYVKSIMNPGDFILDIDNIWECVSNCDRYIKPGKLNSIVFGTRDLLIEMIKMRLGKWNCAYVVGGYPLISERERLIKSLGAREIYIESTKEECLERLKHVEDARDKNEWKKYIEDWWIKYAPRVN